MTIRLHHHARDRMAERGAIEQGVIETVEAGESFSTRLGRIAFRRNFSYNFIKGSMMKLTYDPKYNVAYIRLRETTA